MGSKRNMEVLLSPKTEWKFFWKGLVAKVQKTFSEADLQRWLKVLELLFCDIMHQKNDLDKFADFSPPDSSLFNQIKDPSAMPFIVLYHSSLHPAMLQSLLDVCSSWLNWMVLVKTFLETVHECSIFKGEKKKQKIWKKQCSFQNCFLTRQLLFPGMLSLQYF